MTELPEWLAELTHLQTLDVWMNPLESLPTELTALTLSYDLFERFNTQLVQMTDLKHFGLVQNTLPLVPPIIEELTQLESLDLHGNDLSGCHCGLVNFHT